MVKTIFTIYILLTFFDHQINIMSPLAKSIKITIKCSPFSLNLKKKYIYLGFNAEYQKFTITVNLSFVI